MSGLYYEIRVAGALPDEVLADFERITADVEPVETVLHGPLADQAALHGLLARLEMFGAEVIEVRRLRSSALPPEKLAHSSAAPGPVPRPGEPCHAQRRSSSSMAGGVVPEPRCDGDHRGARHRRRAGFGGDDRGPLPEHQ